MGLLESLLGGRGGGQQPQRQEFEEFVGRYEQGPPWAGISDQEAVQRYQQVTPQLPPDIYQQSAQEAFARLSPQERAQFAQYLRQRAQQQNVQIPDLNRDGIDDRLQDPAYLAQVTGRMHQQQPGMLDQLLGLGGGGSSGSGGGAGSDAAAILGHPLAKAALAGIAAMAAKRMMTGR